MIELLSVEDIIRWLRMAMPEGEVTRPGELRGDASREIPIRALGRAVGIDRRDLFHMRNGDVKIGRKQQIRLTNFIRDWENGMLEFKRGGKGSAYWRMVLVHRKTPRPRAIRMSVSWTDGPKLSIAPRVAPNPRIPRFRDLFAGLTMRQGQR